MTEGNVPVASRIPLRRLNRQLGGIIPVSGFPESQGERSELAREGDLSQNLG